MSVFHIHGKAIRDVHPWCRDSIGEHHFDIEVVTPIVTTGDGRVMKPFAGQGHDVVALLVTIPNEPDAVLFKMKWHDQLLEI